MFYLEYIDRGKFLVHITTNAYTRLNRISVGNDGSNHPVLDDFNLYI